MFKSLLGSGPRKDMINEEKKTERIKSLTHDLEDLGFNFKDAIYVHSLYDNNKCLQMYNFTNPDNYRRLIYCFQRKDEEMLRLFREYRISEHHPLFR